MENKKQKRDELGRFTKTDGELAMQMIGIRLEKSLAEKLKSMPKWTEKVREAISELVEKSD